MPTNDTRGLWRGKRLDNGKWVKGVPLQHCEGDCQIISGKVGAMIIDTVAPLTLGECTGLRDKNGKLIFEGDILKAIWQHLGNTDTVIGIVKYDNAAFILETDDHYLFFEDNIFSYECEVIGNIHDTPELLKGVDNP